MAADLKPSAENSWLFSDEELRGYRAQFDACDEDGGGTIQNDELKSVLRACGMSVTDKQVGEMITEFDSDGNGELDFDEFLAMMFKIQSEPNDAEMKKAIFEVRARARARVRVRNALRCGAEPPIAPFRTRQAVVARARAPHGRRVTPSALTVLLPRQVFDDNLDGLITMQKLMSVWRRAVEKNSAEALPTESEIKAMIAVADLDKDGALDEEEFMRVINTVIPPPPK